MGNNTRAIVITGPTASGKSDAAVLLCQKFDGEIVCSDSMQLYKGMNIGTAKPTKADQMGIPHHLMDILEPFQSFSVSDYKKQAVAVMKDILARGKTPVVCGGTGQYISALVEGMEYTPIKSNDLMREQLQKELENKGIDMLYNELAMIDPDAAAILHRNDTKRILRAIEVFRLTGLTKTQLNKKSKENGPEFNFNSFCITHDREILYARINKRVDTMLQEGLLDEIRDLLAAFPEFSNTACQAIGYKEFIPYLNGSVSLKEAVDMVKQATRNYAKRQLTWFRKMDSLVWIENQNSNQVMDIILNKIENSDSTR